MLIKGTTPDVRDRLAIAGMIRVDGLEATDLGSEKTLEIKGLEPECLRFDGNNGKFAIAIYGEIWIGASAEIKGEQRKALVDDLKLEHGLFVPCSNGEKLEMYDIFNRIADPDWQRP